MNQQQPEPTVLLVEDDDVDVMVIQRVFREQGFTNPLAVAPDGVEALAMLREPGRIRRPVVVLLDLNLPRMNGLEFLDAIRDDASLRPLIVFVLTTSSADEDKCAAYDRNIAGYIVKSEVNEGVLGIAHMLRGYWKAVELPDA